MTTGTDGKLYIYPSKSDHIIVLDGIEEGNITKETIPIATREWAKFPQNTRTPHYPTCNAFAEFDNRQVCNGQPLKILSRGTPPFEITYTLNDEPHSLTTSEYEYTMPGASGRYMITKIKDQNCEYEPADQNTAEIANGIKTPKIVTED